MHLVIGANGDTLLASPAPVPKLLLTTHDLPECPLPKTPSFYAVVSLSYPGLRWVVPHMVSPLGVELGHVR